MTNMVNINGLKIETDKPGVSINGSTIVFSDGSRYDTRTGVFQNAGPGYVKVNGKVLVDTRNDDNVPDASKPVSKSYDFDTGALSLNLTSSSVVVESHQKPGMRVEVTGSATLIESIKVQDRGSTLSISEAPSGGNSSDSVTISNGSFSSISFGGDVYISGINTQGDGGDMLFSSSSSEENVAVRVFVPEKTPISVTSTAGDVEIIDVDGPLAINTRGTADVTASSASESLSVDASGASDVTIEAGNVETLKVESSGASDVRFDGAAQVADLRANGASTIKVRRVVVVQRKDFSGGAEIKIRKIG